MNYKQKALVAGTMAIPTLLMTSHVSAKAEQGTVEATSLNVRATPSIKGEVIGYLKQGDTVSILSKQDRWAKISFNNKEAFVSLDFVKTTTNNEENSPKGQTEKNAKVNLGRLNVRATASTTSPIIGKLTQGTDVTVLSLDGQWARITFEGKEAFVAREFLQLEEGSRSPAPKENGKEVATVDADRLNIRSAASTSASIVGKVTKGQCVSVVTTDGKWAKIVFEGKEAFVAHEFLQFAKTEKPAAPPAQPAQAKETATVNADRLNVRSASSTNAFVVGKLSQGQSVSVISTEGQWTKIIFEGKEAFVAREFLQFAKTEVPAQPAQVKETATVDADRLNVRANSSINGSVIGKLSQGQSVSVLSMDGQWAKIVFEGKEAFVAQEFLHFGGKPNGPAAPPKNTNAAVATAKIATVTVPSLNVRSAPNLQGNVLGQLHSEDKVSVISQEDGWSKISFQEKEAFVTSEFIQLSETNTPVERPAIRPTNQVLPTNPIQQEDGYRYFSRLSLRIPAPYTASELDAFIVALRPNSPLVGTGKYFVAAGDAYHMNAAYLLSHAIIESGWGTSRLAKEKNNLFGFGAGGSNAFNRANSFATLQEGIDYCAKYITMNYLEPSGKYYNGAFLGDPNSGMNKIYANDDTWSDNISSLMYRIDKMYNYRMYQKYPLGEVKKGTEILENLEGATGYAPQDTIFSVKGAIKTAQGRYYEVFSDSPKQQSLFIHEKNINKMASFA